jgi:hypothetical protein
VIDTVLGDALDAVIHTVLNVMLYDMLADMVDATKDAILDAMLDTMLDAKLDDIIDAVLDAIRFLTTLARAGQRTHVRGKDKYRVLIRMMQHEPCLGGYKDISPLNTHWAPG